MFTHPKKTTEEFNSTLEQLYYLTCQYGIQKCKPDKEDSLKFIKFTQYTHEGWKKAQDLVVREILLILDELLEIKSKIKNHNRSRQRDQAKKLDAIKHILEIRKLKLQFVINAIVWTIFGFEGHIVRRLCISNDICNIDRKTLFNTFKFIDKENENPNQFALCCDLTTFVHVGDVLIIRPFGEQNKIELIEIKEGRVNQKCHEVLKQFHTTECPHNLHLNTQKLNDGEKKQLQRMIRQEWRQLQVQSAITTGEGIDISLEKKINIPEETFIIEKYEDLIHEMFGELSSGESYSIREVDECLFLGLYKERYLSETAFSLWMQQMNVDSYIWDYQNVFLIPVARPPFSLPFPSELTTGLVSGSIIMKMCLHIPFWIDSINKKYKQNVIELETKKKSRKHPFKAGHLLKYNEQLIKIKTKQESGHIGTGILSKILFEFYNPIDAMRPIPTLSFHLILTEIIF